MSTCPKEPASAPARTMALESARARPPRGRAARAATADPPANTSRGKKGQRVQAARPRTPSQGARRNKMSHGWEGNIESRDRSGAVIEVEPLSIVRSMNSSPVATTTASTKSCSSETADYLPHSHSPGRYVEGRVTTPPPDRILGRRCRKSPRTIPSNDLSRSGVYWGYALLDYHPLYTPRPAVRPWS